MRSLLYPIPRGANRAPLGIEEGALPFVGEDEWHAFEVSWLNARGKPVVAVARFRLPADSPNLIESKSWKLYLNGFNQSRFASRAGGHRDPGGRPGQGGRSAGGGRAVRCG